ncbi:hypothetical protein AXA88_09015 [Salmonella enterica]|nr:hypothetical protein [Salmonella enterica]EAX3606044.1 hypothetical protein [Salmonella enterica]EGW6279525.1 hypothetical protein [Salmonella enterica]EGX3932950.1 hypothetical protein [Salmonella enterica]
MSAIIPTTEERQRDDIHAQLNPGVFEDTSSWYSGLLSAVPRGVYTGAAKLDEAAAAGLESVFRPIQEGLNSVGINDNSADWLHGERIADARQVAEITPDPYTTGTVAQILYGLTDSAVRMAPGFLAGPGSAAALYGLTSGVNTYDTDVLQGVDDATAQQHALITGTTDTALGLLPFHAAKLNLAKGMTDWAIMGAEKMGRTGIADTIRRSLPLANEIMGNVIGNAALGIASRGFSSDLLRAHGYNIMADQYDAYDKSAIAADMLMGIGFGHFSKTGLAIRDALRQRDIDAALTAAQHVFSETDAAPGMPVNVMSREAHAQALNKAWNDIMSGEPVDVGGLVANAEFLPKTGADRLAAGIREAMNGEDHTDTFIRRYITPTFRGEDIEALEKQYFADLDTERTISGENTHTDDNVAQQYANENPDLVLHHTDDGKAVTVAEAMNEADTGIAQAKQDGNLIDVAVKCFLSGGDV